MPRESLLVRALVELADTLVDDFDVVELLTRLTARSVELLDIRAAGVMLMSPDGSLRVVASSSEAMRVVELLEIQAQEGPCLDCVRSGRTVADPDLVSGDHTWPVFAPAALEGGFRSVHAIPMQLRGQVIGALNLSRTAAGPLDEADVMAGDALADLATIAIIQYRAANEARILNEQLSHALNSRIVIEQAKGVLAERTGLRMEEAFEVMRRFARGQNLRLAGVAQTLIDGSLQVSDLDPTMP